MVDVPLRPTHVDHELPAFLGGYTYLNRGRAGASSRAPAAGRWRGAGDGGVGGAGGDGGAASASDRWIASLNCASSSEAPRRVSRPGPRGGADASLVMRTSGSGKRMTSLVPSSNWTVALVSSSASPTVPA